MKFFTVTLVLALAVAAKASIHGLGLAGSTAIHASNAWAAAPHAGAWGAPAAVTAWAAPVAAHWAGPVAAHWAAPAAAHWGSDDGQWRGDAPGQDGQWRGEGYWAGQDLHAAPVAAVLAAHAGPIVAAHAAPIAHSASYVAANRGSEHVAPLPGHIQSVKSLNVQPAPGTHW